MANRLSTHLSPSGRSSPRPKHQSSQVSTTTLLNDLHNAYTTGESHNTDAATTIVVNTWLDSEQNGRLPVVDNSMITRAWEHARRRAEDACIALLSTHQSTPSCMTAVISELPSAVPSTVSTALNVLRPFLNHTTPFNTSYSRASALAVTFELTLDGAVSRAHVRLSDRGIDCKKGLLEIPRQQGYRVFDVFYYLLISASTPAEREVLGLKDPAAYTLLARSQTYSPPEYLPAADDLAAAEDFRAGLGELGISGSDHRSLLSILAGLLKLGNTLDMLVDGDDLDEICEDVAGLFGIEPEVISSKCSTNDRSDLVAGIYECLIDWLVSRCNEAIHRELSSQTDNLSDSLGFISGSDGEETVQITIVEVASPEAGRAYAFRGIFEDSVGLNAEMKEDGIEFEAVGSSVLRDLTSALNSAYTEYGSTVDAQIRARAHELERRKDILNRVCVHCEDGSLLQTLLQSHTKQDDLLHRSSRFDIEALLNSSRVWYHLSIHPSDEVPSNITDVTREIKSKSKPTWSAASVSRQIRSWRLPEWSHRRNKTIDFTADFEIDEFAQRYARLGCTPGRDGVESWLWQKGWSNGEAAIGHDRVWIHEDAWWEAESMLDLKPEETVRDPFANPTEPRHGYNMPLANDSQFFPVDAAENDLLLPQKEAPFHSRAQSQMAPTITKTLNTMIGDYGLGAKGDDRRDYDLEYDVEIDPEIGQPKHLTSQPMSISRRLWRALVWSFTFWIPSFVLRYVGRMKRPDVRMAWREKVTLVALIALLNAIILFYIIAFGNLLCPNSDKAWNPDEVAQHQGNDDFYVSFHGGVYDLSTFWKPDHSDIPGQVADGTYMGAFAGQNVDNMFTPPLSLLCSRFVRDDSIALLHNTTSVNSNFFHVTGSKALSPSSKLHDNNWWTTRFLPKMKTYYKGDLVYATDNVTTQGKVDNRNWVILNGKIYDLTDYFYTLQLQNNLPQYNWLPEEVSSLVKSNAGKDITDQWGQTLNFTDSKACFDNVFAAGIPDFRMTPRCQVNNYILLAFTIIICAVILIKFISALNFGSKKRPLPQDKFVICQVPAYTEGEDALRKSLDSLTALEYDNKRKLIFVVCDGMIVGGGNDRPTPKIVLDILGIDPRSDPPALPFRSVGQGNEQLNYGKVYSGLYEYEGNVVPYVVVVKVGKESEQSKSKPGNRGKRDSQILLMRFLNRVHHRAPMSPLELEIFHQINTVIGVDPELYEYLLMLDADTSVREDSLNRLVAACANDSKIAGICGETSLENEEGSLWTMIQVYEYYISHVLAKAFESLFGSVTCLPGCFCMYRLRTADKGRPLIINDKIIDEYSEGNVDTLHKKNLLSLGEDRYLTTLMTKHFPAMSYKFVPDAYAATAAPETWSVLLSQRRRWINSTLHNLAELVFLKDLCGFCCFGMRFVVFLDLVGTLILPATCVYLGYLVWRVATHSGQFPLISLVLIAAVYGLQALIFILRRQWQHIGWMVIYLLAFPIYSFLLPIYSFWRQDDFGWGNTRIVIGEKGDKKIIANQDEGFDPRSIPLQRWDDFAVERGLTDRRGPFNAEKAFDMPYTDNAYEMEELRSGYSASRPASTILSGFPQNTSTHLPPNHTRHSTATSFYQFKDQPQYQKREYPDYSVPNPRDSFVHNGRNSAYQSQENLLSPGLRPAKSPLSSSRPVSAMDLRANSNGMDEITITEAIRSCLAEVDLDRVTKKQVKILVAQRLQIELDEYQKVFVDRQIDTELANMDV